MYFCGTADKVYIIEVIVLSLWTMGFPVARSFVLFQNVLALCVCKHVAQSQTGNTFSLVSDDVFFAKFFSFDDDVGHEKPVKS